MKQTLFIFISTLAYCLISTFTFAQAPQKMSYQAVIRNASNTLVANQNIGMRISILQNSAVGSSVYVETQMVTTNANGLASVQIGAGTFVSGNFSTISWGIGTYFIKTETDPLGGSNYNMTSTTQLLSVPYALHAKTSEDNVWFRNGSDIYNYNTGNIGIGTSAPYYKLDVLHPGGTGIRCKSSSNFSAIDIDAPNSDAALRFYKNGLAQWNIRNRGGDDNLDIFEMSGGGVRLVIENGTGNVSIGKEPTVNKLDVAGSLNTDGNTYVGGNLYVNTNGADKGIMSNADGSNQLKYHTQPISVTAILAAHAASGEFSIVWGAGIFNNAPQVFVGNEQTTGGTVGELHRVIVYTYDVTTTGCHARLINTDNASVNYSITYSLSCIGN